MKALVVRQPWASLIASGEKTIEVRSWRTDYRGPLLICAAKAHSGAWVREITVPRPLPILDGPRGVMICVVDLVDIKRGSIVHRWDAGIDPTGQFAWVLANPRPVKQLPIVGRLGLFDVDVSTAA